MSACLLVSQELAFEQGQSTLSSALRTISKVYIPAPCQAADSTLLMKEMYWDIKHAI